MHAVRVGAEAHGGQANQRERPHVLAPVVALPKHLPQVAAGEDRRRVRGVTVGSSAATPVAN